MPIILVFDTETTGLPPIKNSSGERYNYFNEYPHASKWPRIVQLSYILYDTDLMKIIYKTEENDDIIRLKPGEQISKEAFEKTGITSAKLNSYGRPIAEHIDRFIDYYEDYYPLLVGHNIKFDINMLCAELSLLIDEDEGPNKKSKYKRLYDKILPIQKSRYVYESENVYCTMKSGKPKCKLVAHIYKNNKPTENFANYFKGPRLDEAHQILFKQNVKGQLHNALVDISVTLRVYMMLAHDIDICAEENNTPSNIEICNIIQAVDIDNREDFPLQISLPGMVTNRPITKKQLKMLEEIKTKALEAIKIQTTESESHSKTKGGKSKKRRKNRRTAKQQKM